MTPGEEREIVHADTLKNSGVTAGRIDGPGMRFACGCEVTPYRISHCEFSRPADPPKAQRPSGDVERVVRAGIQLAARVEMPDVDNAAAIMEWREAVRALRGAPAASGEEK